MSDKTNRVSGFSNPLTDITITKSPLYREPETDMGDLLGERRANEEHVAQIKRMENRPEDIKYREEHEAAGHRMMRGYEGQPVGLPYAPLRRSEDAEPSPIESTEKTLGVGLPFRREEK
jgi:hypothetical protein